jgi:hypothetical protein
MAKHIIHDFAHYTVIDGEDEIIKRILEDEEE